MTEEQGAAGDAYAARQSFVPPEKRVRGAPTRTRWLVLDAEAVTHVDVAGRATIRERFDDAGISAVIGPDRFHPTVRAAVAACLQDERLQPA